MRVLTFSGLFPNPVEPRHGIFVAERLRQLHALGQFEFSVVAPVPWFPLGWRVFGRYGRYARVPQRDEYLGMPVTHPRYPVIPKLGMNAAPALMARFLLPHLRRLAQQAGGFELIDAHFLYPDGVAAVRLGRSLGVPVVLTARGSDVNVFTEYAEPRRLIRNACGEAAHVFCVSRALRDRLVALGVPADQLSVAPNGVDLERFAPKDQAAARSSAGLPAPGGPVILAVGNLLPVKGLPMVLEAVAGIPGTSLVVAGDGPERNTLERLAEQLNIADRVRFVGTIAQAELRDYYCAADVTVLGSRREGMPNCLLESLACGTPVAAFAVGGVPEIIADPVAGTLVTERSAAALRAGIRAVLDAPPDREAVRRYGGRFAWGPIIADLAGRMHAAAGAPAP